MIKVTSNAQSEIQKALATEETKMLRVVLGGIG
jgi:Fe-S cluster assembly iron-binding protein IscA